MGIALRTGPTLVQLSGLGSRISDLEPLWVTRNPSFSQRLGARAVPGSELSPQLDPASDSRNPETDPRPDGSTLRHGKGLFYLGMNETEIGV